MLKWLPVVDAARCTACEECVKACGPACLEIVDGRAVLTRPDPCGSEEHCIEPCPEAAIRMEWVAARGDLSVGLWRESPGEQGI